MACYGHRISAATAPLRHCPSIGTNSSKRFVRFASRNAGTLETEPSTSTNKNVVNAEFLDLCSTHNDVCLVNPCNDGPGLANGIIVYLPGMDCTGQGIKKQLPSLVSAGFAVKCVCIPSSDRSSWLQLVNKIIPLLEEEARDNSMNLTLVGESFGGRLALHLAQAASHIVTQIILINSATNLAANNLAISLVGRSGLLNLFPRTLFEFSEEFLLPFMIKRNRVSTSNLRDLFSPVDLIPPDCAAWRLSMLNEPGPSDKELRSIQTSVLIVTSAKDRLLSSMDEGMRLRKLLPNSKRVILPESGHVALLEDSIDLVSIIEEHSLIVSDVSSRDDAQYEKTLEERIEELGKIFQPWRILTSPLVTGVENLPSPAIARERPVLFVGNHTLFGIYDSAILLHELYLRGFTCRSLAHPGHWKSGVAPIFQRYGSVKATSFEAYRLLKEGEHVLLFPGGAKEVHKLKGQEYQLLWKKDVDFVRMAARFNAIIVPFGALGGDEAFNILYDSDDIMKSPFSSLVQQLCRSLDLSTDDIQPISGFPFTNLPSLLPIPASIERIYFHFAKPVDSADINIRNREECQDFYVLVKKRVEQTILHLQEARKYDPERNLPNRLTEKIQRLLPSRFQMK